MSKGQFLATAPNSGRSGTVRAWRCAGDPPIGNQPWRRASQRIRRPHVGAWVPGHRWHHSSWSCRGRPSTNNAPWQPQVGQSHSTPRERPASPDLTVSRPLSGIGPARAAGGKRPRADPGTAGSTCGPTNPGGSLSGGDRDAEPDKAPKDGARRRGPRRVPLDAQRGRPRRPEGAPRPRGRVRRAPGAAPGGPQRGQADAGAVPDLRGGRHRRGHLRLRQPAAAGRAVPGRRHRAQPAPPPERPGALLRRRGVPGLRLAPPHPQVPGGRAREGQRAGRAM